MDPPHRGGGSCRSQRQALLRPLRDLPATYYSRRRNIPSARDLTDAKLAEQIIEIHDDSDDTYGSPRVHHELLHRGVAVGAGESGD